MPHMEPSIKPVSTPPFTDATLSSVLESLTLRIQRAISKINSIIITDDPDDYNSLPKTIDPILHYLDINLDTLLKNDLKSRNDRRRFTIFIKVRINETRKAFTDVQKHLETHGTTDFPELQETFIYALKNLSHILNIKDYIIGNYY